MVLSSGTRFWTLFLFISSFQLQIQAQEFLYSSNRDDYDFGWISNGTLANGSVPSCSYCVNAIYNNTNEALDRQVMMYRCDGIQINEMWAYHNLTKAIVFSNLTEPILCIDAVTSSDLRLRPCNSSTASQRWTLDGNLVISGLVKSNSSGEPIIHLQGSLPISVRTTSESVYKLETSNLSARNRRARGNKYTYTDNFTFLSSKTLLNTSTERFTTEGLLQITNSPPDEITNGGFEFSTIPTGGDGYAAFQLIQSTPSYFAFCGWVMDYGPIDYVKSNAVEASEGEYSVHLNTFIDEPKSASISQTSKMKAGKDYSLSFFFRAFPKNLTNIPSRSYLSCTTTYKEARLQLLVSNARTHHRNSSVNGSVFMINFTVDAAISGWKRQIVKFKALANVTTITFKSLNIDDSCGPMIDDVKLSRLGKRHVLVPVLVASIGGVLILAFVIGVLGVVYRKRYCGSEDYFGFYKTEHARVFSKKEIRVATKAFSSVLGEGAFGTVYKAAFPDGTAGAIKVEKPGKSSKVPSEEIAVLLRVHHRNLVNLIGFCIHKGRHMLVFEYLPHGSLYDRLHESTLAPPSGRQVPVNAIELTQQYEKILPWQTRVKIASDVAYGLEYLHHDADPPIVHRDVKSQNILLTSLDSAKLADFGLSKAAPEDATAFESIETLVRGSLGYLDPQYFLTGLFSTKSDVYSYGVVLLEVITGHRAIDNGISLASWAAPYMASPSLYHQLVDEKLNGMFEANELHALVELSRMCMHEDGRMRPNMRQVVAFLNCLGLGLQTVDWLRASPLVSPNGT